jgi:hypothetical protein
MTPRQRYRVAFFALGWLLAIGLIVQGGLQRSIGGLYIRSADAISWLGQAASNIEGRIWQKARGKSRKDELGSLAALVASPEVLRSPAVRLHGVYDGELPYSFSGLEELEKLLDYRFPIISIYQAWGSRPEHQFPARLVETVDQLGSVPMITWEPWVTAFDGDLHRHLPEIDQREYGALGAIARGDYNFHVVPWARAAAAYGKPILLRFGHEMNDPYRYPWGPQNGNRPEEFIDAWKLLHGIFLQAGADNVLWVWSPHISSPWFEYYYPGDDFVDWVGATVLNYGDTAPWSRWWTFDQILNKAYPTLEELGKPIMLSEFATVKSGGDAYEWYRMAFHHLDTKFPAVKMVVHFNQKSDSTITATPLNWSITEKARLFDLFRAYLKGSGAGL